MPGISVLTDMKKQVTTMALQQKWLQGASGHITSSALPDPVHLEDEWQHKEMSRKEAEQALKESNCDCFLIRLSQGVYFLSLILHGIAHHCEIKSGPGWYKLKGSSGIFKNLKELVGYCIRLFLPGLSHGKVIHIRTG